MVAGTVDKRSALRVLSRHPGRPEPRVAGAAGLVGLLGVGAAHALVGRGESLPVLRTQALGGAPVESTAVGGSALLDARLAVAAMGRGRALPVVPAAVVAGPAEPVLALADNGVRLSATVRW